jgi:hypothetical protein
VILLGIALAAVLMQAEKNPPRSAGVATLRVPHEGIQPQVAVDSKGAVHMIYFAGEPGHGDLYYVRSDNAGETFSAPVKVNSHPGSAIASGNIRGAHIALGRNGRAHVAWNGTYEVDVPGATESFMKQPMVYTRLADDGRSFEPERDVIHAARGLDGGGALAAGPDGSVYVLWHAPTPGTRGETNRRVWVARSADDGKTFAAEAPTFQDATGACGCCGMSALADSRNNLFVLFRSATELVHRDIYLLASADRGKTFERTDIGPWNIGACVMSSEYLSESPAGILAAWEAVGNVYYGIVDPRTRRISRAIVAPGQPAGAKGRKYPAVAGNARGEVLLAWAEGMGWGKGGSVAWQVFDAEGHPEAAAGHADGVPAWSLVAAFTQPDGGFTVVY